MEKYRYKVISIPVPSTGATVTKEVETDKDFAQVVGLAHSNNNAAALEGTYFEEFTINSRPIFDSGIEAKMLHSTTGVAPDARFMRIFEPAEAKGNKIKVKYVDGGNASAYPYEAKIIVLQAN